MQRSTSPARAARSTSLAFILLGLAACGSEPGNPATAAARGPAGATGGPPPVAVRVAEVVERAAAERLTFVATVEASLATTIGAEVSGQVVQVPVREGDRVEGGRSVLAQLDTRPREIELREAVAVAAKAREELEKLRRGYREEEVAQRDAEAAGQQAVLHRAEADYRRAEQLHRDELISRAELQRAESEYLAAMHRARQLGEALRMMRAGPRPEDIAQAEAELTGAQARADRIRDEIRRSTVRAPVSGFIVRKHVDVGAWLQPGTAVADLVVLDPVYVTGPVGEREISRVRPGQSAAVSLDAYPGRDFVGVVTAVIPGADPASRTFPVRLTVRNADGRLKPGMFARVAIRTGAEVRALFVPRDAVIRRGRQDLVFVVTGDRAQAVPVETGLEADSLVAVRADGLRSGQVVITLGNEGLQPDARVQVVP